jgi:hypothetical protein
MNEWVDDDVRDESACWPGEEAGWPCMKLEEERIELGRLTNLQSNVNE